MNFDLLLVSQYIIIIYIIIIIINNYYLNLEIDHKAIVETNLLIINQQLLLHRF